MRMDTLLQDIEPRLSNWRKEKIIRKLFAIVMIVYRR
jgi:hypothetical protein